MAKLAHDGTFTLKGNSYLMTDLIKDLIHLNGTIAAEFFGSTKLSIPRAIRISVLRNLLRSHVEQTRVERQALADELTYRLMLFERYGDSQLVALLEFYNKASKLSVPYLTRLWEDILKYLFEKKIADDDLLKLISLARNAAKTKAVVNTKDFNYALDPIFYDYVGEIDGLKLEEFRPIIYRGTTLKELREIGVKYQVPVPKRLKKKELLAIMLKELGDRGELTAQLEGQLKTKNIILLERYCKDHDIKVSTELKKEEIIEYILANAKETKAAYYAPTSSLVYDQLDGVNIEQNPTIMTRKQEVKQQPKETVKEEAKPEVRQVVKEEVKATPTVAEKPVVVGVTGPQIDYTNKLDRIILELERLNLNTEMIYKRLELQPVAYSSATPPVVVKIEGQEPQKAKKEKKKKPLWLKILLIAIDVILILLALIFIFALIGYFFPDLNVVRQINDFVNQIRIGGRGIVDHIHAFADWIRSFR